MSDFQPNTEGIFYGLQESVYRNASGVNISALKKMSISPAHYNAEANGRKAPATAAQEFGTLLHRAALEPERLEGSFVVKPDGMNFATKEGKAWKAEQTKAILTKVEYQALCECGDNILHHPVASDIICKGDREVSVFKRHEPTGILLKGRADVIAVDRAGMTTIADIKTTSDASPTGFPREMAKWGYDMQAAFYMDLIGASFFVFIAVEKVPPYAVGVYNLDAESIQIGRAKNERNLERLAECVANNNFPAYPLEIQEISLPRWAKQQVE